MKRRWIALALLLALAVSLTACQVEFVPYGQPMNNGGTTIDTPPRPGGDTDPVDVTDPVGGEEDPSGDNTDYTMEKYRRYLSGEWIAVEGEVEGDRYRMEEAGMTVTLEFQEADGVTEDGRGAWSMAAWYEYTNSYGDHEKLDGLSVEFHKGPMSTAVPTRSVRGAGRRPGEHSVHRDRDRQQLSGDAPPCGGFICGMGRLLRAGGRTMDR